MSSALTHAAAVPFTRRTDATKVLRTCSVTALLMVAPAGAFAADLAVRHSLPPVAAPYPAPAPYLYNWSGFYVGANIGGAWESATLTDPFFGVQFSESRSGFIGGGQIGYNWQFAPQFVFGIEGMFDGTDIRSSDTAVTTTGGLLAATGKVDWIATIAARFGWAANNWLFYGKAGGGWVHDTVTLTDLTTTGLSFSQSDTKGGWLVGAGIEYGITQNWTIRVEWDHLGLSSENRPGFVTLAPFDNVNLSRHFDMVTAGLNYKF
jgi:outer membrane immunogenic protein